MVPIVLQFNTLIDLAAYSRQLHDKGYRINVQHLTLTCKLNHEEVAVAQKKYAAIMLAGAKADA